MSEVKPKDDEGPGYFPAQLQSSSDTKLKLTIWKYSLCYDGMKQISDLLNVVAPVELLKKYFN